jgi:hypothetical protein
MTTRSRKTAKRRKSSVDTSVKIVVDFAAPAPPHPPNYIFVGIDPGRLGAISALFPDGRVVARHLPLVKVRGVERYDAYAMHRYMRWLRLWALDGYIVKCLAEEVTMRPFEAKRTVLAAGMGYGHWVCLAHLYGFELPQVHPSTWKAAYGFRRGKKTTAEFKRDTVSMCRKLYPSVKLYLEKDEALAEATLIADYLKRTYASTFC